MVKAKSKPSNWKRNPRKKNAWNNKMNPAVELRIKRSYGGAVVVELAEKESTSKVPLYSTRTIGRARIFAMNWMKKHQKV